MYVLGLESTAHTFGVGITDGKDILSNVRDTYLPEKGGIIPSKAAEHHYSLAPKLIEKALSESGLKLKDIDVIAFSQGPGIFAPLKVSFQVAKYLSEKFNKKMIGVNHCIAHLEIARKFTGFQDPVMLYVSGGNTQVITFE
ncbi:MAG: UGMP family protein, partial [Nanoarchaeota archaeon]|nr:UGMP family protein [Nanoarchaeota archaeon]